METVHAFHRFAAALGCANVFLTHLWTGRILRSDKRGSIPNNLPPILQRLNIERKQWLYSTQHFERSFKGFAGTLNTIKNTLSKFGYQRFPTTSSLQA
jgi:hypothetical protein